MPSADPRHQQQQQSRTSSSSSSMGGGGPPPHCSLPHRGHVDDVWHDIMRQEEEEDERAPSSSSAGCPTLDEFLARSSHLPDSHREDWLPPPPPPNQQQQQPNPQPIPVFAPTAIPPFGYAEGMPVLPSLVKLGAAAAPAGEGPEDQGTKEARRADEVADDRTADRKQKRMIKNRESAARSRAKKQAYINQLEEKARWLEETNKVLRRTKEWEMTTDANAWPMTARYRLRRTQSAPL